MWKGPSEILTSLSQLQKDNRHFHREEAMGPGWQHFRSTQNGDPVPAGFRAFP